MKLKKFSLISKVDDINEIEFESVHVSKKEFIDYSELVTIMSNIVKKIIRQIEEYIKDLIGYVETRNNEY